MSALSNLSDWKVKSKVSCELRVNIRNVWSDEIVRTDYRSSED